MEKDNKGQELEIINYLSRGNQFVLYIFRKISKVSEAVYIVTDMVKDAEPIKWSLREVASESVSLKHFLSERSVFNAVERMLLELEGLLDLAHRVRVLSDMNAILIQNEIRKIVAEIKESSKGGGYESLVSPLFFEVPKPAPKEESHKGQHVLYDFYNTQTKNLPRTPKQKISPVSSDDKGQRRQKILSIIKQKGLVTIKDIMLSVRDCSEKTIQRELTQMVLEGVLLKTGERRWSRYSVPDA
ncbi:MAG: hypothetical protein V4438_02690 [Patescibacteria group bacterium]